MTTWKYITDGTPQGTKIIDDQGRRLRGVTAIGVSQDTGTAKLRVILELYDLQTEILSTGHLALELNEGTKDILSLLSPEERAQLIRQIEEIE